MSHLRYIFILFCFFIETLSAQNFTIVPLADVSVSNIPIEVEHYVTTTNGIMDVRIFRTHYGTGTASQYQKYPSTRSEMDKLFNSGYAATTLWWTGTLPASRALAFTNYTTLTSGGASVPSNGNYYSLEATCTFVPTETGTYYFRMTSDDGSDLQIGNTSVIEWYGGKGIGQYRYGSISLVAGQQYYLKARMQEYSGGDGLIVQWQKPSGGNYILWTNEIGVSSSSWVNQGTKNTDVNGYVSFSNPNLWPYRYTITSPSFSIDTTDIDYFTSRILQPDSIIGFDWMRLDITGDSLVTLQDLYTFGYFSNTSTISLSGAFYTSYEYGQIINSQSNQSSKYPPLSNRTFTNLNPFVNNTDTIYMPVMTKPPLNYTKTPKLK
jgi:hypothetical protein